MTEEKYTIEEIRRAYAAIVDDDIDSLVEELQRKESEFVKGQFYVYETSIGSYDVAEHDGLPLQGKNQRHLNPTEAGPKYVPVEEMRKFVSKIELWHGALPSGYASNAIKDALDALPANLRGDSDE